MANIFNALAEFVNKPNRNTFDMSFQNNLTMNFGTLFPVFCKEVIPGDSFRIRPTFGLRFMPLVFPIQTRMQANLHFFYVRNRNLWKDWPDFIGNTKKNLVPPYLSPFALDGVAQTGALGDYLGLPTTLAGSYGVHLEQPADDFVSVEFGDTARSQILHATAPNSSTQQGNSYIDAMRDLPFVYRATEMAPTLKRCGSTSGIITAPFDLRDVEQYKNGDYTSFVFALDIRCSQSEYDILLSTGPYLKFTPYLLVAIDGVYHFIFKGPDFNTTADEANGWILDTDNIDNGDSCMLRHSLTDDLMRLSFAFFDGHYAVPSPYSGYYWWALSDDNNNYLESASEIIDYLQSTYGTTMVRLGFFFKSSNLPSATQEPDWSNHFQFGLNEFEPLDARFLPAYFSSELNGASSGGIHDISSVPRLLNPYRSGALKVSALPFRAYESIYNAFYRNQFNDPFMIDGQKEYNKFLRNTDGGADNLVYELYNRNWELDFLTSARQSPVDGDITPLVGVTGSGKFVFENEDGTRYTVTPVLGEDGHTLTGIESVQGSPENNSGLRRLIDMASVGISINDFRNVNALQRWLETNLRRGYRYRDQILSHFGVDVKYEELDMPEFIGGMSEPVIVNQVNQMSDQTDSPSGLGDFSKVLGSFAGQASILAQSRHEITKYCDEHGFIIGILSVSPVPNYSQLLPKHFIKNSVLDYYFPTFGHIGNQPITYREVCPLQSFAAGDSLDDVFGYQRAWYDYIASVDEVHGDFRTSLEGFLINRVFASRPELGKEFITIDKDSMSNPFSVTDDTDKILGEVYFDVEAQRPIPKLGIPRLE